MNGLRVGQPIDLRTGFDILTAEGRRKTMELVDRQRPKFIFMAPVCGPWSIMNNINDQQYVDAKCRKYLPMLDFCVQLAEYQREHDGYFMIENPSTSALWYTRCFQRLLRHSGVTYGTLDMCSFGLKDPNAYYYYKPTSLLHNFDEDVLAPVFKRCISKLGGEKRQQHQLLEGSAPGHGSRTKLAQGYPYRFCSTVIRAILPIGRHYGLFHAQTTLLVDLLDNMDNDGLKSLSVHVNADVPQENVHFSILATRSAVPVKNIFIKRLMTQINALAAGYEYNPCHIGCGHNVVTLRKHFSPHMSFDTATILRGTFEPLRVRYRQTSGLLFMWRKKDTSQLYVLRNPNVDLSSLMPSQWSCILLWNSDGKTPVEKTSTEDTDMLPADQPDYPPGLPPERGIQSEDLPMIPDDQPDPPTYFPPFPPEPPPAPMPSVPSVPPAPHTPVSQHVQPDTPYFTYTGHTT